MIQGKKVIRYFEELKKNNLTDKELPQTFEEDNDFNYNCHGFTCYTLGLNDRLEWIEPIDVNDFLKDNTVEVSEKEVKMGDIVLFGSRSVPNHTAILISEDKAIQKLGACELCIEDLHQIPLNHFYGEIVGYRRIKGR